MDETTDRWALPLLHTAQAQKEITHNEAILRLDLLVQPVVEAVGLDTPPADPQPGQAWIVGLEPSGAWAGRGSQLAGWTAGGWRFAMPRRGMHAWSRADEGDARFGDDGWRIGQDALRIGGVQVVGPRQPAIPAPVDGLVIDVEARAAIDAIRQLITAHGLAENG